MAARFTTDVVVLGGGGRVGLPLAIALAAAGSRVVVYDTSAAAVEAVNGAVLPFEEPDAALPLKQTVVDGRLTASSGAEVVADAEVVVVVIGTPVDEHLNPDPRGVLRALHACRPHLRDGQLIVLRSTVYPGVTAQVERVLREMGLDVDVAFCPERIAEGRAMTELHSLPQIVGARTDRAARRASALFGRLTARIVTVLPEEAELAKLFTNAWRYIKFATANQFFMMANDQGLDFERIRAAVTTDYPRAADLPGAGFAAGPCLFKDTMQLAAFHHNDFVLGHAAMAVNEGLPLYLVARLEQRYDLPSMTVGILGMAFKGDSDDTRSSLSYKLRKILEFKAGRVLCTDPHVTSDPALLPLEEVLDQADLLLVAAPHSAYRDLTADVPVVDVWNLLGRGVLV